MQMPGYKPGTLSSDSHSHPVPTACVEYLKRTASPVHKGVGLPDMVRDPEGVQNPECIGPERDCAALLPGSGLPLEHHDWDAHLHDSPKAEMGDRRPDSSSPVLYIHALCWGGTKTHFVRAITARCVQSTPATTFSGQYPCCTCHGVTLQP